MLMQCDGPVYLRLGLSEEPKGWPVPEYAPWRKLLSGNGSVLAGVGPLVGGMLTALEQLKEEVRPEVWLVTELPITDVPAAFMESVRRTRRLLVVEEHTVHGGFGQMLAHHLTAAGAVSRFLHPQTCFGICLRLIWVAKVPPRGMRSRCGIHCRCGFGAMTSTNPNQFNEAGSSNIRQLAGPDPGSRRERVYRRQPVAHAAGAP